MAFEDQIALANALGGVKPASQTRRKKSKVLTAKDFESMGLTRRSPVGDGGSSGSIPEIAERAAAGEYGADRARRAYERLMSSSIPDSEKERITKLYEDGNGSGDEGLWDKAKGAVGDTIGTLLMAIDKPKRAIVATVEEGLEELGGYEDGQSWADNVLRAEEYGYGDTMQRLKNAKVEELKAKGYSDDEIEDKLPGWATSTWGMRGVGLLGDILLDPLTYATAGTATAPKAAKALGAVEDAADIGQGGRVAAKGLARRLEEVGKTDEAAAVIRRGTREASAADLAEVGLKGGLRVGGKTVIPQDVWRQVTRPAGAVRERVGGSSLAELLQRRVGNSDLADLRVAMRAKDSTPRQVLDALGGIDSYRAGKLAGKRFGGRLARDLEVLLTDAEKAGVDGQTIRGAVAGDTDALASLSAKMGDDAADRFKDWVGRVRTEANDLSPEAFIRNVGDDYMPRYLTDEAAEFTAGRHASKGDAGSATFENRAFRKDDKFGDEVLGSDDLHARFSPTSTPGSRDAIEKQMEGLLREWGFEGSRLFSDDAYEDLPRYLASVTSRVEKQATLGELLKRGVLRPDSDVLAREGAEALGAAERANQRALRAQERLTRVAKRLGLARDEVDDLGRRIGENPKATEKVIKALEGMTPKAVDTAAQVEAVDQARRLVRSYGAKTSAERELEALTRKLERWIEIGPDNLKPNQLKALTEGLERFDSVGEAARIARQDADQGMREAEELLAEVQQELAEAQGTNTAREAMLRDIEEIRSNQVKVMEQLLQEQDRAARHVLALEAQHQDTLAKATRAGHEAVDADTIAKAFDTPEFRAALSGELQEGMNNMAEYGLKDMALSDINYEAFNRAVQVMEDPTILGRFMDKTNRFFKSYATLTPGFHVRNHLGATFNNFVAGVNISSYRKVGRNLAKFRRGGMEAVDPEFRKFFEALEGSGSIMWDDAQIAAELGKFGTNDKFLIRKFGSNKATRNIGVTENAVTNASREMGDRVEKFQRTVLAYDVMRKGGTLDEALDAVATFHFDYSDLSHFERKYMKRIVPFWTWTSRNLPMQMEMIWKQPKMYQRFRAVKDNLGDPNEPELVPAWMSEAPTAIHLGGGNYFTLDLPVNSADELTRGLTEYGPMSLMQSAAPVLKSPVELKFGKQAWNNIPISDRYAEVPKAWQAIPGLIPALKAFNRVETSNDGRLMIDGKTAYALEQAMPIMGRARRLAPSEDKYQGRRTASILSFFGIGFRSVTERDKKNEVWSRTEALEKIVSKAKDLGDIEVEGYD